MTSLHPKEQKKNIFKKNYACMYVCM